MTKRFRKAILCVAIGCAMALAFAMTGCSTDSTYEPEAKTPQVQSPTIKEAGVLRVGVNTGRAPLAGMSGNKIVGIDKFSTEGSFWKSDSYLPTGIALFAMSENAAVPTATTGAKFAAQVSSTSAWAVMNEFGDTSLTSTSSPKEAFAALSSGQVQYVAADAVIGKYYANGSNINVSIIALMQQPSGYCVGVLDSNSDLKTAIANAVSSLNSSGVMGVIQSKWLGGSMDLSSVKLTAGATSGAKAKSDSTTNGTTSTDAVSADAGAQSATSTDTTAGGASTAGSNAVKAS